MEIPKQLQGFKFCRVRKGTKKPFEKDWTKKPYTYKEIKKFLSKENYGVLCGYENLSVIDCDSKELQLAVEKCLPITFRVKTGGGGTHNYFFVPNLEKKLILESGKTHLGEIQSYGTQVVGPNSIHPNKRKYEVLLNVPISKISQDKLMDFAKPFIKEIEETEEIAKKENEVHSEIDNLSISSIWGLSGLKKHGQEYYGSHPIHNSEGGMNFWINPLKNTWHCFRHQSGGGPLSAIAVKEGIIDCSEAKRGKLRGQKVRDCLKIAEEKYGLIKESKKSTEKLSEEEIQLIWDKDLQSWKEEEKEWIVDKLIPSRSVCILTGKRGTLKTFVTLLLSYSVAAGIDFLGKYPTKKGIVIYLDKENGIPIMKQRTRMIKKGLGINDKDMKIAFICFSQLKIDKIQDISKIEKTLEKEKPSLFIIDTYRRGISFDENDAGAVSQLFVDTLRPLVEKNNISIILIHHNRKGISGEHTDEMDELRGSSDLANYADIILKMERKGENVILKQLKNRNAQEIEPIKIKTEFEEKSVKMIYEGNYQKQSKADKCVELILTWIAKEEIHNFSTGQVRTICLKGGYKETTIKNALVEMIDTGIIERKDFGTYSVL